ncbi:MAG: hypothetical protein D6734_07715 [Candidatus Schekmanbacteria bacterium]|nr:MAG: hypothetical protein D6734_07715 [Candidatus Schekmanbacteria bacterium]
MEAGENIEIKTETNKNKITISSKSKGGIACYTGVVIFRNIKDNTVYSSNFIELPPGRLYSIMLGVEVILGLEKIVIRQGDLPRIELRSHFYIVYGKSRFTVLLKTTYKLKLLRVRWWAIETTRELEPVEVDRPKIDSHFLLTKIALNPDITLSSLSKETGFKTDEIDRELEALIEAGHLKVTGSGVNRKYRVVSE